ncbi:YitT family protein [Aliikangiella sp. IMCC44359]|uniref:YitT family protein n=1 Tax=Aliikangiella sp. IMCC44359 TaxID=3459125 RepID=UPI00403B340E
MNKNTWFLPELKNLLLITFGSTLLASGVTLFLLPAKIATGGTPGMAIIVHFLTSISTGTAMLLITVPLLIAGFKFIDLKFALRSLYSIIVTSILVDFLPLVLNFPSINSLLLSTLYGGIFVGAGVGFILKGHASAGGTSIIARIVSHYSHIKPAQTILILDVLIIITISTIFSNLELALWSMLNIYATTQVIDKILTGTGNEKTIHIVSHQTQLIGRAISEQLERDGTILSGKNLTVEAKKSIIFVVVEARRLPQLKSIVLEIDPQALMIVMEASEIMGTSRRLT